MLFFVFASDPNWIKQPKMKQRRKKKQKKKEKKKMMNRFGKSTIYTTHTIFNSFTVLINALVANLKFLAHWTDFSSGCVVWRPFFSAIQTVHSFFTLNILFVVFFFVLFLFFFFVFIFMCAYVLLKNVYCVTPGFLQLRLSIRFYLQSWFFVCISVFG